MANFSSSLDTDRQFRARLDQAKIQAMRPLDRDEVTGIVQQVISSLAGDISLTDLKLYAELESLARYIQHARGEISALKPLEIRDSHIPTATDELDAVISATESATNRIMDACDQLSNIAGSLEDAEKSGALITLVTEIFEACNFQDITGQRINKVVRTLRTIESKIEALVQAFGEQVAQGAIHLPPEPPPVSDTAAFDPDRALLHGPQLPGNSIDQDEIDRLLASFD